jgi:hypothetical protein
LSRADNCHGFLSGKKTILVKPFVRRQLVSFAEEAFQIFLCHVAMTCGNVNNQPWSGGTVGSILARPGYQLIGKGATHQTFDRAAVQGHHA